MNHHLRLISYGICPFVQRATLLLEEVGCDYTVEYIDISDKPAWFLALSPAGKVPLLQVGEEVLFESTVILEYLNDLIQANYHPADILVKAKQKALIEFSSSVIMTQWMMLTSTTQSDSDNHYQTLIKQLSYLESQVDAQPYFNGHALSMIDIAMAPLLQRLNFIDQYYISGLFNGFPRLSQWKGHLLKLPSLQRSASNDLAIQITNKINATHSIWAKKEI